MLSLLACVLAAGSALADSLALLTPNGGTAIAGQPLDIKWTSGSDSCVACIEITYSDGTDATFCADSSDETYYQYSLPSDAPTGKYTIEITQCSESDASYFNVQAPINGVVATAEDNAVSYTTAGDVTVVKPPVITYGVYTIMTQEVITIPTLVATFQAAPQPVVS